MSWPTDEPTRAASIVGPWHRPRRGPSLWRRPLTRAQRSLGRGEARFAARVDARFDRAFRAGLATVDLRGLCRPDRRRLGDFAELVSGGGRRRSGLGVARAEPEAWATRFRMRYEAAARTGVFQRTRVSLHVRLRLRAARARTRLTAGPVTCRPGRAGTRSLVASRTGAVAAMLSGLARWMTETVVGPMLEVARPRFPAGSRAGA